jgi:RNA polymerase sigma-70 factor (ECF subfamily)
MAIEYVFDRFIDRLRRGDEDAAAEVFRRFAQRLVALARSQLESWLRTRVEPEDVVQSVFRSFFTRFRSGQFRLDNWDNLWTVLALITVRKCANRVEFWQAARRNLHREVSPHGECGLLEEALARDPTPLEAASLSETVAELLRRLPERDRAILASHLQGHDVAAISDEVGLTERTVRRTLERVRRTLMRLQTESEEAP